MHVFVLVNSCAVSRTHAQVCPRNLHRLLPKPERQRTANLYSRLYIPPSPRRFVHTTCTAYCQGLSASELFDQLHDDDFLQSGGLVPVSMPSTRTSLSEPGDAAAAAAQPVPVELLRQDVNKQLFSTWLSITCVPLDKSAPLRSRVAVQTYDVRPQHTCFQAGVHPNPDVSQSSHAHGFPSLAPLLHAASSLPAAKPQTGRTAAPCP